MGCTQSKIENEEMVNRCKDRKMFMKDAVASRNAFAAAHFAYTMSLKNTGAALSDYSQGEVDAVSSSVSSSLPPPTGGGGVGPNLPPPVPPQAPYDNLPPPPPPLPNFTPSPLQRASSMPEFVLPKPDLKKRTEAVIEEEEEDEEGEIESESVHGLRHRSSSRNSGGGGGGGSRKGVSSRDMESENLTTPPPPLKGDRTQAPPPPPPDNRGVSGMSWDFFFPPMENVPGPSLAEVDENRIEREEIERKAMAERAKRSEMDGGGGGGDGGGGRRSGKAEVEPEVPETVVEPPPPPTPKPVKKVRQAPPPPDGKRAGKGGTSINLIQIFNDLDDCFLKASESAHEVSKMLEANRLHYHSNFADNRGIIL